MGTTTLQCRACKRTIEMQCATNDVEVMALDYGFRWQQPGNYWFCSEDRCIRARQRREKSMIKRTPNLGRLADALTKLTWSEMMDVAQHLLDDTNRMYSSEMIGRSGFAHSLRDMAIQIDAEGESEDG